MILFDTGVLVAYLDPSDTHHEAAKRLVHDGIRRKHGQATSCDYVLDEGLTFLRAKVRQRDVCEAFAQFFFPTDRGWLDWTMTDQEVLARAKTLFLDRFDRGLSMTDCVVIEHARQMGAMVATFDSGFNGLVDVVA